MRRALSISPVLAALAMLPLVMFGAWMNWAILDPRRIGWLLDGNDRGQNSLGLIAYLRSGAPWPSLHNPLFMAPEGLGVPLTDSNPLLALILRPLTGWLLPHGWQYAGWWLLSCLYLQVFFAWLLVRPFARDQSTALAATALLAATPILFARYGHINLCAQWLILWALWIFVDERRAARPAHWMAVIALAWLIHPYLLVMVAAIWSSAQFRRLLLEPDKRLVTLAEVGLVTLVLVGMPALLGYFDEPLVSTGSYGMFNMALDAPWNAGNQGYSAVLPAASDSQSQGFEGFNYLGAGLLGLILLVAVCGLARQGEGVTSGPQLRGLLWLLPAYAVLAAIAVGQHLIWRGEVIATLPIPESVIDALDPVRASGRMFWPASYTIMFAAIAGAARMREARTVLLATIFLQILDIGSMMTFIRGMTTRASSVTVFERTRDPRWAGIIQSASAIDFHPHESYQDLAVMEEVAWRAISAKCPVPLTYFYASREPRSIRNRLAHNERAFARGQIDPTQLYVLLNITLPPALAARAVVLDGITIIPPSIPARWDRSCLSPSSPRSAA